MIEPEVELFMLDGLPIVPAGQTVKFIYVLKGCPIPEIQLYFNDELVSEERLEGETATLHALGDTLSAGSITLNRVGVEDTGEYKCLVKNVAGNATSSTVLLVVRPIVKRSVEDSDETEPCPADSPDTG